MKWFFILCVGICFSITMISYANSEDQKVVTPPVKPTINTCNCNCGCLNCTCPGNVVVKPTTPACNLGACNLSACNSGGCGNTVNRVRGNYSYNYSYGRRRFLFPRLHTGLHRR